MPDVAELDLSILKTGRSTAAIIAAAASDDKAKMKPVLKKRLLARVQIKPLFLRAYFLQIIAPLS